MKKRKKGGVGGAPPPSAKEICVRVLKKKRGVLWRVLIISNRHPVVWLDKKLSVRRAHAHYLSVHPALCQLLLVVNSCLPS